MCDEVAKGVPPRGQALVNRATKWLGPAGFDPSRLRPSACALRLPVLLAGSELFAQNGCRYLSGEGVQPKGHSTLTSLKEPSSRLP